MLDIIFSFSLFLNVLLLICSFPASCGRKPSSQHNRKGLIKRGWKNNPPKILNNNQQARSSSLIDLFRPLELVSLYFYCSVKVVEVLLPVVWKTWSACEDRNWKFLIWDFFFFLLIVLIILSTLFLHATSRWRHTYPSEGTLGDAIILVTSHGRKNVNNEMWRRGGSGRARTHGEKK